MIYPAYPQRVEESKGSHEFQPHVPDVTKYSWFNGAFDFNKKKKS